MSHPSPASRPLTAVLVSGLVLLAALLFSVSAEAASAAGGKAVFTLGSGKAGKVLKKQKVKIRAIAPAKVKRLSGKRVRATLRSSRVALNGTVRLKGGLRFVRGKRTVRVKHLGIKANKRKVWVFGTVAGRSMTVLLGGGGGTKKTVDNVITVNASSALKLTRPAARLIRRKLKLRKKVPAGAIGRVKVNASQDHNLDPYFAQCGISGTSKAASTLSPAAPLPDMTGAEPLADTPDVAWGLKASFRAYMGMAGSLHAVDGAGRDGAGPTAGFTFPVGGGSYKANDPADTTDDQAVINGEGAAVFCNPGHGFRIAIANPTIVIDGTSSRIIADVDTNYFGIWTPAQRVDLADLDLEGITPFYNRSGSEVTWQNIPATLTATGAEAFCEPASEDRPGQCLYHEGDELDPATAEIHADAGSADPFPFPAYCDWTTSTNTMRIAPNWPEGLMPPLDSSDIAGVSTTGASLDWGVKAGLRGNQFNVITPAAGEGATMSNPGDMTGAGKYFTWTGTTGTRDSAGGRLVQNFAGRVGLCNKQHGYGTVISDPTVVIDGDDSRLSADVATRVGDEGDWVRGRVDFVTFKASELVESSSTTPGSDNLSWTTPDESEATKAGVVLTEQGAKILKPISDSFPSPRFQGMTIRATVPTE